MDVQSFTHKLPTQCRLPILKLPKLARTLSEDIVDSTKKSNEFSTYTTKSPAKFTSRARNDRHKLFLRTISQPITEGHAQQRINQIGLSDAVYEAPDTLLEEVIDQSFWSSSSSRRDSIHDSAASDGVVSQDSSGHSTYDPGIEDPRTEGTEISIANPILPSSKVQGRNILDVIRASTDKASWRTRECQAFRTSLEAGFRANACEDYEHAIQQFTEALRQCSRAEDASKHMQGSICLHEIARARATSVQSSNDHVPPSNGSVVHRALSIAERSLREPAVNCDLDLRARYDMVGQLNPGKIATHVLFIARAHSMLRWAQWGDLSVDQKVDVLQQAVENAIAALTLQESAVGHYLEATASLSLLRLGDPDLAADHTALEAMKSLNKGLKLAFDGQDPEMQQVIQRSKDWYISEMTHWDMVVWISYLYSPDAVDREEKAGGNTLMRAMSMPAKGKCSILGWGPSQSSPYAIHAKRSKSMNVKSKFKL